MFFSLSMLLSDMENKKIDFFESYLGHSHRKCEKQINNLKNVDHFETGPKIGMAVGSKLNIN